ncbi:hypothetical protein [Streptococcus suis]|uniref:hypothetical protein n=1 Tax=Streptococcus suis TaxID=1307 RepID=UPI0015E14F9C|nr:hypothetical protein [Streptococcus suis]
MTWTAAFLYKASSKLFLISSLIYPGDMIRACKSGLINLYQEDGQSLTIRA